MRDAEFVKIAKALADPTRHRMLRAIRGAGEMTCSDLCAMFTQSQPTISHHIKALQASGLILIRRDGPFHVLSVDEAVAAAFAGEIARPRPARRKTESRNTPPRNSEPLNAETRKAAPGKAAPGKAAPGKAARRS